MDDFRLIDLDHHYYEPDDCFTRHLEAEYLSRGVHVQVDGDGRREWAIGTRPLAVERRPRDYTPGPGELAPSLAAHARGEEYASEIVRGDDREFRDRDARVARLDEWGIESAVVFPSAGLGWEAQMTTDPEAACATARAFNRWLEDDWGYDYRHRIFAAPIISLLDVDAAAAEVDRVLGLGARIVMVRPGPVAGRSPADPHFDPFWARVAEAGVPVAVHIAVSGYEMVLSELWGEDPTAHHENMSAFQWYAAFATRPIVDTLAAFVFHNLFGRHPALSVVSIENGSAWVAPFLRHLDAAYRFVGAPSSGARWIGGRIDGTPSEIFKRHVYLAPFLDRAYDAPVDELVELLGSDRVVFGSDWPHSEGRKSPLDFMPDFASFSDADRHRMLRANAGELLGLPV